MPAGPLEALPLVGPLHQVQLVSPPQAQPHPESPRRVLLVALPPEALPLVAPLIRESPPLVPQPLGLLVLLPQVGQQQEKRQAVGPSPQWSQVTQVLPEMPAVLCSSLPASASVFPPASPGQVVAGTAWVAGPGGDRRQARNPAASAQHPAPPGPG